MEVYGLTGGIGSGKSMVAAMLQEYGIPVVSADELSRMVVAPGSHGLADVVQAFGAEVLDGRGELDRKKMGQIVFATPERRRQLESILHPRIRERYEQVLDALEKAGHPVMVYEVPLLFEKKLDEQDEMKAVILVTASADARIARVKARDSLTTEDVIARMRAQMPEPEKRARADYIIHNDGDLDDLRREVEYLLSRFLRLPPRAERLSEESLEEVIEIEEIEDELDESDIATLSPEDVNVDDTYPQAPAEPIPAPQANAAVAPQEPAAAVPTAATAAATSAATGGVIPAGPQASTGDAAKTELEVELHPLGSSPSRSGSTWIPASPQQASQPTHHAPIPAPPPTGQRKRPVTAPQLDAPSTSKAGQDDQEPGQ